ncbi:MAG TPA: hypothetical protein VGD53_03975 [Actinoallomurus sp.]|jgi:hypothetical protein
MDEQAAGVVTESPVPTRAELCALLLGLAGRIPDDALAEMRLCLADGEVGELASLLAEEVFAGGMGLTGDEAALARALFERSGAAPGLADRVPRLGSLPPAPYRFGGEYGTSAPDRESRAGRPDGVDALVVAAGERVGGLTGIWRVFRHSEEGPARRVYLAEAEVGADVLEPVAEIQYALTEASADTPRVEVFTEHAPLPPYHEAALDRATLVWAASDAPVRLARAFDGADPSGGPYFDHDHPRLEGPDAARVLAYLTRGEPIVDLPGGLDDVLDPGRPGAVPVGFRSDGRWVWPDAVAYYLKHHDLAPEPDLVAYVLAGPAPRVPMNRVARHRGLTTLFASTGGAPVWQAG